MRLSSLIVVLLVSISPSIIAEEVQDDDYYDYYDYESTAEEVQDDDYSDYYAKEVQDDDYYDYYDYESTVYADASSDCKTVG